MAELPVLEHLLGVARLLVIAGAPLLLGAALLGPAADRTVPRRALAVLVLWCVILADIAVLAGWLHVLGLKAVIVAALLTGAGAARALARQRAAWQRVMSAARAELARTDGGERAIGLALLLAALALFWQVAAVPVIDWDSWAFHLPTMARWLQAGEFVRLEQYATRPRNAYPGTWGAVCALFMLPFGEDLLVALPALTAWAILGLATALVARDLTASRMQALAAAALVLSMPHLQGQVNSLHVDLPFAAFFMAAFSFALAHHRRGERRDLALCLASLAILCGLRVTGLAYAATVLGTLLIVRRLARERPPVASGAARSRALDAFCVASFALLAPFWWLRNLADYGSPLGPIALRAADLSTTTFKKPLLAMAGSALAFSFDPFDPAQWAHVAQRAWNEMGLPLPVMLIQLALLPAALRGNVRRRHAALFAAGTATATVLLFLFTPTSAFSGIQLRLGFPALACIAAAGAVGATAARVPGAIATVVATLTVMLAAGHSRAFQLGAILLAPAAIVARWRSQRGVAIALGSALAAGLVVILLAARERRAEVRAHVYGPGFVYLDEQIGDGEPLAYFLSDRSYHFYGTRLHRPVRYLPPPAGGPTAEWFTRLRDEGIRVVVIGPFDDGAIAPEALARLERPEGELVRVFGSARPGEITVYRFPDVPPQGDTEAHRGF